MAIITPYDNKVGVWMVHGADVGEETIDELAQTLLTYAPAVNAVWVKTSDGSDWMARYDTKPAMWIDGPAAIDKWVNTLQKYGLEFHAWCVPRGLDINAETNLIIQACQRPGVRSMVLDVEPYTGFWAGGQSGIRPYMLKLRSALPGSFHIGLSVDGRRAHYNEIFPAEWFPFVNSVHPQVYWPDFGISPQAALADAYAAWGSYNRPIFPVLSAFGTQTALMDTARTTAVTTYHATGFSWWAFGRIDLAHFVAVNHAVDGKVGVAPPGADGAPIVAGTPITVTISSPNHQDGVYDPSRSSFGMYQGPNGVGKYRPTDQGVANVYSSWEPHITQAGWYKLEAYIPVQHGTSGNARYKVHGVKDRPDEYLVSTAQSSTRGGWVTIGTFQIDPTRSQPGATFLNDWTFETGREVAFDALRWTPVSLLPPAPQVLIDVPYRSQEDADARRYRNDCGAACVAMYIDFVRQVRGLPPQPISIDQLASETTLAQDDSGLRTDQLIPLAAHYGVTLRLSNTLTLPVLFAELSAGRPPLVLIAYGPLTGRENQSDLGGHFLIVTGYDTNYVYVNDPDWWNNGSIHREQGHNWQLPMTQFKQAIAQAAVPNQGLLLTL